MDIPPVEVLATAIIPAVILVLLYVYLTWHHSHWAKKGMAFEIPTYVFGSLRDVAFMKKSFAEVFIDMYGNFPSFKVVGFFMFRLPGLMIRDPELIQKITGDDFEHFMNNVGDVDKDMDPITSRNLYLHNDEEWKKSRELVEPLYTVDKVKSIYPQVDAVSKEFIRYLKKQPLEVNLKEATSRYSACFVAACGLGTEVDAFKNEKPILMDLAKKLFQPSASANFKCMLFFGAPFIMRLLNMKCTPPAILKFFEQYKKVEIENEKKCPRNDFVSHMIELKKKNMDTGKYTNDDILSGCVTYFIEAIETTAAALQFAIYDLAMNPTVQDKLKTEIDEFLKKGDMSLEAINELKYLNGFILESLRFHPVIPVLSKTCTKTYTMILGQSMTLDLSRSVSELTVDKGINIAIPVLGVHLDPRYWQDPNAFKPERFENGEDSVRVPGSYLPFGIGPRKCLGADITKTVLKSALVNIMASYELQKCDKTPAKIVLPPAACLLSHNADIFVKFIERKS